MQPGPTLRTAAVAALEAALDRALALDPASRARLADLDGQVFHLHCTRPAIDLYLMPSRDRLGLASQWQGEITAALSGEAEDFAKLLAAADPAAELINGRLAVRGDSRALQTLQQILKQLEPDWEEPLTRLLGDVAGHGLAQGLRRGIGLAAHIGRRLQRQAQNFLVEESDWLAPRWQVEQFHREVDQLVMRSDRLEARLQQLRQQLARRRG
jgi:ubiquinone biosynthesis protein UbiJ